MNQTSMCLNPVRLVPLNMFKLSSDFFADHSAVVHLLWILFMFVFVTLLCLFLAAL